MHPHTLKRLGAKLGPCLLLFFATGGLSLLGGHRSSSELLRRHAVDQVGCKAAIVGAAERKLDAASR